MGKKKLSKYSAAKKLSNIIQPEVTNPELFLFKETWNPNYFKNGSETVIELGCGKGEYTVNLAKKYPDKNFIGVDIKSDRMLYGARAALEENLPNVCFVRIQIEFLAAFFPDNLFSEGWITFPDPHESNLNGKRRLTSGRFLDLYRKVFKPGSSIHLKTDSEILYNFSKESIAEHSATLVTYSNDLYNSYKGSGEPGSIQTKYEKKYLAKSKKIKYIQFTL